MSLLCVCELDKLWSDCVDVQIFLGLCHLHMHELAHMGLTARKPVFEVSDKMRFKSVCSATETS